MTSRKRLLFPILVSFYGIPWFCCQDVTGFYALNCTISPTLTIIIPDNLTSNTVYFIGLTRRGFVL